MWADGVLIWLMEQLDTGVLRWGARVTLEDGTVAIDPSLETGSPVVREYVPLDRPTRAGQRRLRRLAFRRLALFGRRSGSVMFGDRELEPDPTPRGHLREARFDVGPGRTAYAGGRLIRWLQLYLDDRHGSPPVDQLVVSWPDEPAGVAQLEYLGCEPLAPHAAVEDVMLAGVHAAADAGACWIEHRFDDVDLLGLGLRWQPELGVMRLKAADVP
jgi:hypothetical protein